MSPTWLPLAPILIPLSAALLLPVVDRLSTRLRNSFSLLSALLTLASLVWLAPPVLAGRMTVYWLGGWTPRSGLAIGISLAVDAWGLLIALIVAVIGTLCLLYAYAYLGRETGRSSFYILFLLLIAALIGFVFSGDLFNQFVWLEVFSVAAFALTGFNYEDRLAIEAAFKYLITNSIAALFIAVGLALFYMQTGALNIAHIASAWAPTPAGLLALALVVGGYATKAALAPWHFWLPDAHTAAPTPVSAQFSGALIKVGVYAAARNLFTLAAALDPSSFRAPLLALAMLSLLVGGWQMLQQQSIKRILAYSSVSQMGYALLGLAVGTPLALTGAALHLVHHALTKAALFMGAGVLGWRAGLHELPRAAGGLARRLPVTFAILLLGSLSLSGMPFFSGFVSKTLLEEAAAEAHLEWAAYAAIAGSALTLAGLARLLWRVFGPAPQTVGPLNGSPVAVPQEAPLLALLPMALLVAGVLAVGAAPQWAADTLAWPAAQALLGAEAYQAALLAPQTQAEVPLPAVHPEPTPHPTDWHHWPAPLLAVAGGGLLAAWRMRRDGAPGTDPLSRLLGAWHSGRVNDYALWTAAATTLLMLALLVTGLR